MMPKKVSKTPDEMCIFFAFTNYTPFKSLSTDGITKYSLLCIENLQYIS